MSTGIYKRKTNSMNGKYERTPEIRRKMSLSQKKNPVKYWLGKKIPEDIILKIKETKKRNGKTGNLDYFKTHSYIGEMNSNWKGDDVGYYALHTWVYRKLGKPKLCEFCGKDKEKGKKIHWANKSHEYKRELSDWLSLCAKCHYAYDRK